jgi:DNA processing protein
LKMMNEKTAIWVLAGINGLGAASVKKIVSHFGSAAGVFDADEGLLEASSLFTKPMIGQLMEKRDGQAMGELLQKSTPPGAGFVSISEPEYPEKLKNIGDPPPYLYFKGRLDVFDGPSLAIVGSRRPTDYGRRITPRLAGELASMGVLIVSGLAFGIDAIAHQAALEAGGRTAAVFGCGLDYIYPRAHSALASRIIESGSLLSEFPKGTRPERFNFPVRNRIISGLTDGVLVVEAAEKSGALVTASLALDQGRDVLAIPGNVESKFSYGPNDLIKQGAVPVTSVEDIMTNFGWHKSQVSSRPDRDLSKLSLGERALFDHISVQPVHVDELGRKSRLSPARISELLLSLEIKGFIMRKPGNYVVKA